MSFTSKEFLNLNKTLLLLRKIFLFIPDRIRGGWQRKQIGIDIILYIKKILFNFWNEIFII